MRVLVLDDAYPSEKKLYADMFAHVRVREYKKHFATVGVLASFWEAGDDYTFDGVDVVTAGSHDRLVDLVRGFDPDVVAIHFATFHIIRKLIDRLDVPYVVWSHGYDAVGWWRRLYQRRPFAPFLHFALENMAQRYFYRRLLRRANATRKIAMVFVSKWLARVAQTDVGVRLQEVHVIPNPIDTRRFVPIARKREDRLNWLILRPTSKSGFDILVDALRLIESEPWFESVSITFVGDGVRGSRFDQSFGLRRNVSIVDHAIPQNEIARLHRDHGVFLAPTRQDSHGVSACEAMASGLCVVSCANSAVPEFVDNGVTGILSRTTARSYAEALKRVHADSQLFLDITENAPSAIAKICGIDSVIEREVALICDVAARDALPRRTTEETASR